MVLAQRWLTALTGAITGATDDAAPVMASHGRALAELDCDDGVDVVLDVMIPLLVLCLMFGMGATVTFSELKTAAVRRPKALFTGAFCQFGIMPLLAFVLGLIFDLNTSLAISLVVVGACPGGTTSQLFSFWAGGDVALSIAMTVFSTGTALFMQPLILFLYMQAIDPDTELKLAIGSLIVTLLVVLLPVLLGAWINTNNPVIGKRCALAGSISGFLFIIVAIVYGSVTESHLFENGPEVWICAFALLPVGMLIGYAISRWVTKLSVKHQRTVSFETGLQNSGLGITIVTLSFSVNGCIDRSLLTFPLFYSVAAVFECIVISLLWGRVPVEHPPKPEVLANQVHTVKEMGPDGTATTIYRSLLAKDGLISTVPGDSATTLYENFFKVGVARHGKENCLGTRTGPKLKYSWLTYTQVGNMAMDFGRGLNKLGAPHRGRISLYSKNRSEWVIAEQGCNAFTLTTVPLYDTLGPDTAEYITKKMNVYAIVCGPEQRQRALDIVTKVAAARKVDPEAPGPSYVIVMDGVAACVAAAASSEAVPVPQGPEIPFSTIIRLGRTHPIPAAEPAPEDIATVCFTSGTTGLPKGAVLTHASMIACMSGAYLHCKSGIAGPESDFTSEDVHISYLPLAHMFERATQAMLLRSGAGIGFFQGEIPLLVGDIQELHPTIFAVVPRLLNKIYSKVKGRVENGNSFKRWMFYKAYNTKLEAMRTKNTNIHGFWDSIVFANVAASLGGRVRAMITGSAPLSSTVMEFMRICFSCHVLEGYGQTETSAASHITIPGDMSMGHVGVPLPCIEVKLDDVPEMGYMTTDEGGPRGEICFRGPNVFQGYFEDPERTAEAVKNGWLHSGDIGRINANGTLSIIDRRKNLFKLAQGEYVSPEKVENVYIQHPVVEQVWVHGNSLESFLIAVVSVNALELQAWAATPAVAQRIAAAKSGGDLRLHGGSNISVAQATVLLEDMTALGKQAGLHSFEQAKSLALTGQLFAVENGLITPTMKLRRTDLRRALADTITRLYSSPRGSLLVCQELMAGDSRVAGKDAEAGRGAGSAEHKPPAPSASTTSLRQVEMTSAAVSAEA